MEKMFWGLDLGGTKVELAILDQDYNAILRERMPTEASQGYEHILGQIQKLISFAEGEIGSSPDYIGIGTPGSIDKRTGLLKNSNTLCLNGHPLHSDLEKIFDKEVRISNDANCFAVAEVLIGAGKELDQSQAYFGVIMGTGVGGGLVVNGQVVKGRHGIGGEWGHNVLIENGTPCYCGKAGCVEKVISGPALENYYESITGRHLGLSEIVELARGGVDEIAMETLDRLCVQFGKAISVVINIVDPEAIILGGGLSKIDELYTRGAEEAKKHIFTNDPEPVFLKPALGDSAGVFGAALL